MNALATPVHIVEVDGSVQRALASLPSATGIRSISYTSGAEILRAWTPLTSDHTDGCVLISYEPPDMSAVQLTLALREQGCTLPVLLLAANSDAAFRDAALRAGASDVFDSPLLGNVRLRQRQSNGTPSPEKASANTHDVTLRSMQPEDADIEQAFVRGLSPASRHMRFFSGIKELSTPMLHAFTHPNFPASCALIATIEGVDEHELQIGVARYAPTDDPNVGEFAVVVADDWQGSGVGVRLLRALIVMATAGGLTKLEGAVLAENRRMLRFMRKLGFASSRDADDATVVNLVRALRVPRVDQGTG